jgi:replicative DNA helicase
MSGDKPDENDLLKQGKLSPNAFDGTVRTAPLRLIENNRRIGEAADPAAENALLGSLLWCGSNQPDLLRVGAVVDILPDGKPFYSRTGGQIYDGIVACTVKDETTGHVPVEHDPVAVAAHIAKMGNGSERTGIDALLKLQAAASTVSEAQARAYAESIRSCWAKREAVRGLREIVSASVDPAIDDTEIYERASKAALEIMERSKGSADVISIKQSAQQLFDDLSKPVTTISTGLIDLDQYLNGGLRAPETSIIAARTSVGKSTLAGGIAASICENDPTAAVLYVSLEMPHKSFTTKLIAARAAGVTVAALRRKSLNTDQWRNVTAAVAALTDLQLFFTVSMTQTLASVYKAAATKQRALKKDGKRLVMVVIDHVGLVKASNDLLKRATREQQVAETSRGMRWIADSLGMHVMALAQIHRDAERQKDNTSMPKLHHLRESGALEQDADTIMIAHRPRSTKTGIFIKDKPTALAVAKSRMDETGVMLLEFANGRYRNWPDPTQTYDDVYKDDDDA